MKAAFLGQIFDGVPSVVRPTTHENHLAEENRYVPIKTRYHARLIATEDRIPDK